MLWQAAGSPVRAVGLRKVELKLFMFNIIDGCVLLWLLRGLIFDHAVQYLGSHVCWRRVRRTIQDRIQLSLRFELFLPYDLRVD